jgi:hypothetical protein
MKIHSVIYLRDLMILSLLGAVSSVTPCNFEAAHAFPVDQRLLQNPRFLPS